MLLKRSTRKINSQKRGLINFLTQLARVVLPSMKNVLPLLAKRFPEQLGLAVAASAIDLDIKLLISNEETDNAIKMFNSLEESGL